MVTRVMMMMMMGGRGRGSQREDTPASQVLFAQDESRFTRRVPSQTQADPGGRAAYSLSLALSLSAWGQLGMGGTCLCVLPASQEVKIDYVILF